MRTVLLALSAFLVPVAATAAPFAVVHHAVATTNSAAQAAFDRGLTRLYSFNRLGARKAFLEAAADDPQLAMAYWGVAMSYGENINIPPDVPGERAAVVALRKAQQLAPNEDARDRAYIEALAARYSTSSKPDFHALAVAYQSAMRRVVHAYPDDPDAGTLYAESGMNLRPWDLYVFDGTPRPGTLAIVAGIEGVLARFPTHIGAEHLYIHATEASTHPERALRAAGTIASLTFEPADAHLVHMPAHTWVRTGYYHAAGLVNVTASQHDDAYIRFAPNDSEAKLYHMHDMMFLQYAAASAGDFKTALRTAQTLAGMGSETMVPMTYLRFARWNAILSLPRPHPSRDDPTRIFVWHFARGMAFAHIGNIVSARKERREVAAMESTTHWDLVPGTLNPSRPTFALARAVLDATIAEHDGRKSVAIALYRRAVAEQDTFTYTEPPDWYEPIRETFGGALLREGSAAEAAGVFREDLKRNPKNPRSLFGLAAALQQLSDPNAAAVRNRFEKSWTYADVKLSVHDL